MERHGTPQYVLTVTVWHGPTYGHAVDVDTVVKGRRDGDLSINIGTWRGIGIPVSTYRDILTSVNGIFSAYLIHRYGVAESLPGWEVEPEPF